MGDAAMKRKHRDRLLETAGSANLEATYVCDSCGEEIVVPLDVSAGSHQDYVEDCPVCCNPMVLHVDIDGNGDVHVDSEHE
jgi:transcription elongation factor Elf1